MVSCDLIHQAALEDRQPVAETNDDVSPKVFFCFEEQAVRVLGRMLRRESSYGAPGEVFAAVGAAWFFGAAT